MTRFFSHRRRTASFAVLLLLGALGGCGEGSIDPGEPGSLAGGWRYAGIRQTPVEGTINGSVRVRYHSGTNWEGEVQVREFLPDGSSRRISGLFHGTIETATGAVEFDFPDGALGFYHRGVFAGDSIVGEWDAPNGGSGTFVLRRQ